MNKTIITILLFACCIFHSYAAPARPDLRTETLPDGSSISYYVTGDEKYHYTLSTDGYVMIKNGNGYYTYAQPDENGYLIAGNVTAHDENNRSKTEWSFLQTISPYLAYHPDQVAAFTAEKEGTITQKAPGTFSVSANGNTNPYANKHKRNIVILVRFKDVGFTISDPKSKFTNLLNQEGYSYNGATGSVRDYFIESSFGAYQPTFDVYGPYTLNNNVSYYALSDSRAREMVRDACNLADNDINFAQYSTSGNLVDNVCIIFAGNNSAEVSGNYIWPHRWTMPNYNYVYDGKSVYDYMCTSELRRKDDNSGSEMAGIGTFTHEFSHLFDLPDLYNTVGSSSYRLDTWDVMDGGMYANEGRTPPTYSSYERYFLGWLTPEILDAAESDISLANLPESNKAYILAGGSPNMDGYKPNPAEFFMIENRQQKMLDTYLPYHGMLVWHISYDSNIWQQNTVNNGTPQRVYLVRADGKQTKATEKGDPFPGNTNKSYYSPAWWNDGYVNMSFTNIKENDEIITFDYVNGISATSSPSVHNIKLWASESKLHISGIEEETQLDIIQLDGKIIKTKILTTPESTTDIIRKGVYIVRLTSKNAFISSKIIIL